MLLVTGVDPLGAVANAEVAAEGEAGNPLQNRDAILFGGTGIDRGLIDDDVAFFQRFGYRLGGLQQDREVWPLGVIHRRRYRYDMEVCPSQLVNGVGKEKVRRGKLRRGNLAGPVMTFAQLADSFPVDVKADGAAFCTKGHCHGEAHVTEADNGYFSWHDIPPGVYVSGKRKTLDVRREM